MSFLAGPLDQANVIVTDTLIQYDLFQEDLVYA